MCTRSLILLLAVIAVAHVASAALCDCFNNYKVSTAKKTYAEAVTICASGGGRLVVINNVAENDYVKYLASGVRSVWVGVSATSAFRFWHSHPGAECSSRRPYIVAEGHYNGMWLVASASAKKAFICESPSDKGDQLCDCFNEFSFDKVGRLFGKAESKCRSLGDGQGHLVTIQNKDKNSYVSNFVAKKVAAWMGLSDRITEGEFLWTSGSKSKYTNWLGANPTNHLGRQDYVVMIGRAHGGGNEYNLDNTGMWDDTYIKREHASVCEFSECHA